MMAILESRRTELDDYFADTDLKHALLRLMDFTKEFSKARTLVNEAVNLNRHCNQIAQDERQGRIADAQSLKSDLCLRALALADAVVSEAKTTLDESPPAPEPRISPAGPTLLDTDGSSFEGAREKFKRKSELPVPTGDAIYFCKDISRGYRRGRRFTLANISLQLCPGEITGLVGLNASGKTTLLRIIAGELRPYAGHYIYPLLHDGAREPGQIDWGLVRSQISHVRQHPYRWFGPVVSNLYRHAALSGLYRADNETEVDFILERLGLAEYRDARWHELSGGYRMRFELAKALISRPKLLILDEPLAPLDVPAQLLFLRDVKELAASKRQPLAVIISSQHLYEIEAVADKLVFLNDGVLEFYGRPEEIGADRWENTFELVTPVSAEALRQALKTLVSACEKGPQKSFYIRAPLSTSAGALLAVLLQNGIEIHYFRDVSRSTRSLFGDKKEMRESK